MPVPMVESLQAGADRKLGKAIHPLRVFAIEIKVRVKSFDFARNPAAMLRGIKQGNGANAITTAQ
jgi:hypothetical protein